MSGASASRLPDHWAVVPFDLLFDNVTSSSLKLPKSRYVPEGKHPVIDQGEEFIGGYTNEDSLVHPGPIPAIVFGDHTRCVKFAEKPFVQGADGVKVLAPSLSTYAKYAYWALKNTDIPNRGYARHFSLLRKAKLPLPPTGEQHLIVEAIESYFTRLDDAVTTLERVQRNLKRYRASVLRAAVKGRLVPTEAELARAEGRDYEPASVLMDRVLAERRRRWEHSELAKMRAKGTIPKSDRWKAKYKEPAWPEASALPDLPNGWCWVSLGACATLITKGSTPTSYGHEYQSSGINFVRVENLRSGRIDQSSLTAFIDAAADETLKRSRLEAGDLLISIAGTIGRTAVVHDDDLPANTNQALAIVRGTSFLVTPDYLRIVLSSNIGQEQTRSDARGGAMNNISLGDVKGMMIPVPPPSEQTRLVAEIDRLLTITGAVESEVSVQLTRLSRLRQSILRSAFEGRLVDHNPNDEPAAVLLERITEEKSESAIETHKSRGRRKKRSSRA